MESEHGLALQGRRVVVTRAREQAGDLSARLRSLGAIPIEYPAIAFEPPPPGGALDRALQRLEAYDWVIFTSANGVRFSLQRLRALGLAADALRRCKLGAIGPATAAELEQHGLRPQFVPDEFVAEAVVAQIPAVEGQRVLLPRADIAREALPAGLQERGAVVEEVAAYRTVPGSSSLDIAEMLRKGRLDAVTFTSSSTVRHFFELLGQSGLAPDTVRTLLDGVAVAAIGPITAGTARELGLHVTIEAERYTVDGLVAALVEALGARR